MEREEQSNKKIDKAYISSLAFDADECEICLSDEVKKEYGLKFKNGKFLFFKKKPKYPKNYEECCRVMRHTTIDEVRGYKADIIEAFQQLLICRDAYWKIAGDWESSDCQIVYGISRSCGKIEKVDDLFGGEMVLELPSREMRDAFYENFKELIEECKELL